MSYPQDNNNFNPYGTSYPNQDPNDQQNHQNQQNQDHLQHDQNQTQQHQPYPDESHNQPQENFSHQPYPQDPSFPQDPYTQDRQYPQENFAPDAQHQPYGQDAHQPYAPESHISPAPVIPPLPMTTDTSYMPSGAFATEPHYQQPAHEDPFSTGTSYTPPAEPAYQSQLSPPPQVVHSQPVLAQPEPHPVVVAPPQVTSPFQDPSDFDRRNSSYSLHPEPSNPFSTHNVSFGPNDDPYNADYDDQIPLTNYPAGGSGGYSRPAQQNHTGATPYPMDDNEAPGGTIDNLFRRLTTKRPARDQSLMALQNDADLNGSVSDFNLGFAQGLPQVDGMAHYSQPQNAYFPEGLPYNNPEISGYITMPEPDRPSSVTTEIIDYSWQMRQQQPTNENYTKRHINLVNGVFQAEYPVPSAVKACVEPKYMDLEGGSTEFTHMRYTAATVDPDYFDEEHGYVLRAKQLNRETELMIVVTYYSEDKVLTARTLYGIMKNVHHLCADKKSKFWSKGSPAWQKIVVSIIMDGIEPCRKDTLDTLAAMGIYQDGVMKKAINDDKTVAHIFEYTSQISISPDLKLLRPSDAEDTIPPIQYILCLKQENSKKINSHRWLFNAFSRQLQPNICVLIDAGTKPASKSIVHLWRAFYNNDNIGGACGEIHAMLGKNLKLVLNPLVAAQNFEYKIANILDKPLESTFGFISVLPGAFSAYRYQALQGRPLEQYFLGDHSLADRLGDKGLHGMNIFTRNMFLAEDRILCFEITFKKGDKWHLQYVKASKAETDVPEEIDEFISQRRRWLNGSFAATLYSMMHFAQIYRTGHNPLRMVMLHFQLFYNFINIFLTWLSLAAFYLTTTVIMSLAAEKTSTTDSFPIKALDGKVSMWIALILRFLYLILILSSFIMALGNRPKGSRIQYKFLFFAFGIIQTYSFVIAIYLATQAFSGTDFFSSGDSNSVISFFGSAGFLVILALASTFGLYFLSGLLYLDLGHLVHSLPQYMFIMPSFTNVVNVYAFCNWHDVSWGTKGADKGDALPEANSKKNEDGTAEVVEEFEKPQEDIDLQFNLVMERALKPYPKEVKAPSKPDTDDQNKAFRTNLVLFWVISNAILAVSLTTKSVDGYNASKDRRTQVYFLILIIITAIMSLFRFVGCVIFVTKSYISRGFAKK